MENSPKARNYSIILNLLPSWSKDIPRLGITLLSKTLIYHINLLVLLSTLIIKNNFGNLFKVDKIFEGVFDENIY